VGTIRLIRMFFIIVAVVCGFYIGSLFSAVQPLSGAIGAVVGLVSALSLILIEVKLRQVSLRNLSAAAFGLVFGFFIAWLLTLILRLVPMDEMVYTVFQIIFTLIFCYLGIIISIKGKDEFNLIIPYVRFSREDQREEVFLLDTSVIIDGRIMGLLETGFLEGKLLVPRFVLNELQQIADSSDDAKRVRGKRGLDMLNILRKMDGVEVIIHDESLPDIKEVDAKLVRLAKMLGCKVITNDMNLNKVAKIDGVRVLNINDLSNSLRMVISPGEEMIVQIRKEGKERNQGVAFLDDGTMIVVENGRRLIGRQIGVAVTSVLQTSAGRMVFASPIEKTQQGGSQPRQQQQQRGTEHQRGGGDHQRGNNNHQRGNGDRQHNNDDHHQDNVDQRRESSEYRHENETESRDNNEENEQIEGNS